MGQGEAQHYIIVVYDASQARRVIKLLGGSVRAVAILALVNGNDVSKLGGIAKNYSVSIMKGYLPLPS